jgi:hypothetical protein
MISRRSTIAIFAVALLSLGCCHAQAQASSADSFGEAVSLVNRHSHVIVLSDQHGASIAVWPAMQGRVLTSSVDGARGRGFGWINRDLIASGKVQPHMNAVGGEDRLWLGPEGGQYGIFFAPGAPFDLDHWFTPPAVDTEAFDVVGQTANSVAFRKAFALTNFSGTKFRVQIDREVRLLPEEQVWKHLGLAPVAGLRTVGFESENKLTNLDAQPWKKSTGLLSLWVLGQFQAAPEATIILPLKSGPVSQLGPALKTDYFGSVPADRIAIGENSALFKADANYRSKLGISPARAKGRLGSYDPQHHVLTIVQYDEAAPSSSYVNSAWEMQKNPYKGDVANCYNDGPLAPGKPGLGHFYELESSSPAVELASHASVEHTQRTIHLTGPEEKLDGIAVAILGVHLKDVRAFRPM